MDTPLQLEDYFFPHVRVSADPGASEEKKLNQNNWKVKIDVIKTENKKNNYQVSLSLSSFPESEEKRTSYTIELVTIGFFKVSPTWDDPIKLLEVTGASILYASAREFLITITARGPWGAIMLPTASFLRIYNQKKKEAEVKEDNSEPNHQEKGKE